MVVGRLTNAPSRQLVPLVVLFIVIGGLAFVGYQIYLGVNKIQAQATKNIGNKNITFTKDGVRVNVKEVKNEKYVDATQKVFVDVWNQHATNIGLDEQRKRYVHGSHRLTLPVSPFATHGPVS
jgi:hypothetical protein